LLRTFRFQKTFHGFYRDANHWILWSKIEGITLEAQKEFGGADAIRSCELKQIEFLK
jgi:hypothetical protein